VTQTAAAMVKKDQAACQIFVPAFVCESEYGYKMSSLFNAHTFFLHKY
jgi:hypothetical protein